MNEVSRRRIAIAASVIGAEQARWYECVMRGMWCRCAPMCLNFVPSDVPRQQAAAEEIRCASMQGLPMRREGGEGPLAVRGVMVFADACGAGSSCVVCRDVAGGPWNAGVARRQPEVNTQPQPAGAVQLSRKARCSGDEATWRGGPGRERLRELSEARQDRSMFIRRDAARREHWCLFRHCARASPHRGTTCRPHGYEPPQRMKPTAPGTQ